MNKRVISVGQDYTQMLPVFRDVILQSGMKKQGNLIFAGCPGPCYSMATLLSFGIKDLDLNLFFAADSDVHQLWRLEYVQDRGMIATRKEDPIKAEVIVLMSGLCAIPIENTIDFLNNVLLPDGVIIGEAPAPGLFEEKAWDKKIPFNFIFEFSMKNPTSHKVD